jgi:hypothetical protein
VRAGEDIAMARREVAKSAADRGAAFFEIDWAAEIEAK